MFVGDMVAIPCGSPSAIMLAPLRSAVACSLEYILDMVPGMGVPLSHSSPGFMTVACRPVPMVAGVGVALLIIYLMIYLGLFVFGVR